MSWGGVGRNGAPRPVLALTCTPSRLQSISAAEASAQKANNIAIAGVVIAVVLAVVAITLAAVYVVRTKHLDQKYSK